MAMFDIDDAKKLFTQTIEEQIELKFASFIDQIKKDIKNIFTYTYFYFDNIDEARELGSYLESLGFKCGSWFDCGEPEMITLKVWGWMAQD